MTEDDKLEFEMFFKEIKREERELSDQKSYQITLKGSVSHIVDVIQNQATEEQLKEYKNVDLRVKEAIERIDEIIKNIIKTEEILQNVKINLEDILNSNSEIDEERGNFLKEEIEEYNENKKKIDKDINNNRIRFLLKELNYISDKIRIDKINQIGNLKEVEINLNNPIEDEIKRKLYGNSISIKEHVNDNEINDIPSNNETLNSDLDNTSQTNNNEEVQTNIQDNKLLIISERTKKVYLPYTQDEIQAYMRYSHFNTEDEVIEKVFTVPLSKYTNFTVSRVKEGFKLMREREKASFGESLKYAFSLTFERKLHPAIITACKTQDDLDIYLACLEDNVLSLFDCFEVKFDYAPTKVKTDERLQYFEGV